MSETTQEERDWIREDYHLQGLEEVQRAVNDADRLEQAERERDESRQQAETWAQEARTQRETVREIYQLCTGATGEPGDWNGAEPVRAIIRQRDEARGLLRRNHSVLCWLTWLDPVVEDRDESEIKAKQKQAAQIMNENDALLRGEGD